MADETIPLKDTASALKRLRSQGENKVRLFFIDIIPFLFYCINIIKLNTFYLLQIEEKNYNRFLRNSSFTLLLFLPGSIL